MKDSSLLQVMILNPVQSAGSLACVFLLAAVAFFGGNELGLSTGLVTVLALFILIAGLLFWLSFMDRRMRERKRLDSIYKRLEESESGAAAEPETRDEAAELRKHFEQIVEKLGATGQADVILEQRPWYLVLGRDGAGRSSLLEKSGIDLTRIPNEAADVWLSHKAVFVEPSGRYFSERKDGAPWKPFLRVIRDIRRRQPLSGILVALSAEELFEHGEDQRKQNAAEVRARIEEATEVQENPIPVWFVVTKSDRIRRFAEFAEALPGEKQGDVFGITLPYEPPRKDGEPGTRRLTKLFKNPLTPELFHRNWEELSTAVSVHRLQALSSPEADRTEVIGLPESLKRAGETIWDFVQRVVGSDLLKQEVRCRGIYLTSVRQEDPRFDLLESAIPSLLGIPEDKSERKRRPGSVSRSFFTPGLFASVLIPDSALTPAYVPPTVPEPEPPWITRPAGIATVGIGLLLAFLLGLAFSNREEQPTDVLDQLQDTALRGDWEKLYDTLSPEVRHRVEKDWKKTREKWAYEIGRESGRTEAEINALSAKQALVERWNADAHLERRVRVSLADANIKVIQQTSDRCVLTIDETDAVLIRPGDHWLLTDPVPWGLIPDFRPSAALTTPRQLMRYAGDAVRHRDYGAFFDCQAPSVRKEMAKFWKQTKAKPDAMARLLGRTPEDLKKLSLREFMALQIGRSFPSRRHVLDPLAQARIIRITESGSEATVTFEADYGRYDLTIFREENRWYLGEATPRKDRSLAMNEIRAAENLWRLRSGRIKVESLAGGPYSYRNYPEEGGTSAVPAEFGVTGLKTYIMDREGRLYYRSEPVQDLSVFPRRPVWEGWKRSGVHLGPFHTLSRPEDIGPISFQAFGRVRFSPDGTLVARRVGTKVAVWDTTTGEIVREIPTGISLAYEIAFAPDGSWLAVASDKVRFYDPRTGKSARAEVPGMPGPVQVFEVSPDGNRLAFGPGTEKVLRIYDLRAKKVLYNWKRPGDRRRRQPVIRQAWFLSDNRSLVAVDTNGAIAEWQHTIGRQPVKFRFGPGYSSVGHAALSRNGKHLIVTQVGGNVGHAIQGKAVWTPGHWRIPDQNALIWFFPEGLRIAVMGDSRRIRILDVHSGEILADGGATGVQLSESHLWGPPELALSRDGMMIAEGLADGRVRLYGLDQ